MDYNDPHDYVRQNIRRRIVIFGLKKLLTDNMLKSIEANAAIKILVHARQFQKRRGWNIKTTCKNVIGITRQTIKTRHGTCG